jgi:hypothetical protein
VRAALPGLGFRGLSTFKPRATSEGLVQINTHIDIVDWPGTRRFVGTDAALAAAVAHLAARRTGTCDGQEPTGLLTHHLAHDEGCREFVADFVRRTRAHAAARWLAADEAFAP